MHRSEAVNWAHVAIVLMSHECFDVLLVLRCVRRSLCYGEQLNFGNPARFDCDSPAHA